jgi:hypothetical protein
MNLCARIAAAADLPPEDVELWVVCEKATHVDVYLREGRIFRNLSLADLRRVWKAEFRAHVKAGGSDYPPLLSDLTWELELRDVPPPEADIPCAWKKDQARFDHRFDESLDGDALDNIRRKVEAFVKKKKREEN